MNFRKISLSILLFVEMNFFLYAQELPSGKEYRRTAIHNGNLVRTVFGNWGVVGQPGESNPRGSWLHDNNGYIGDVSPLFGVEITAENGINQLQTFHSVTTCPIDRPSSTGPEEALGGKRWGFEPVSGYFNESNEKVAMSTDPTSWPGSWPDKLNDIDDPGWRGSWNGYFGKDLQNIQQESYYVMDDNNDEEFNFSDNNMWGVEFKPDDNNLARSGLGLEMSVRGMQWQQFLAQDCLFWLYEVTNASTTDYTKATFGMLVGTYVGVTGGKDVGEADDDWSFFDVNDDITYTGDYDNDVSRNPNWVGDVGMVGYAFLESPGNPFDGIDNDGDYLDYEGATFVPIFEEDDFDSTLINVGDRVISIDNEYNRTEFVVPNQATVDIQTKGKTITLTPGNTKLVEGNVVLNSQGDEIINPNAYDGIDNDLDGLIDENYFLHYRQRRIDQNGQVLFDVLNPRAYIDYINNPNIDNTMVDERRDDGIDNDNDWDVDFDDVGTDGISDTYDYGEGDGFPTPGEPNFDQTDVDESDQIGLTSFDYFSPSNEYPWKDDEALWNKLRPGFFDTPDNISNGEPVGGSDGDFIYGSGYFPLQAGQTERLSLALVYGEDLEDLIENKRTVQNIYNNNYRFPPPPRKPTLSAVASDDKITLYWNRIAEEHPDPITKQDDFQGYKLYRATDSNFNDVRNVTNAHGLVEGYIPIMQWDKDDDISGYFYPSNELFQQTKGYSYYLGDDTGLVHSFVDEDVVNGRTYYYALVAYDRGDTDKNIFPAENSKFISILSTGEVVTDINTLAATPTSESAGYSLDSDIEVIQTNGVATGQIQIEIIDETALTGHEYQVEFFDTSNDGIDNDSDWSINDDHNNNGLPDTGDLNIDINDNEEYSPMTTFYSVRDVTGVEYTFMPEDTLTVQLPYENIIKETVLLKNSIGNTIPKADYYLIYETGKLKASSHGSLGSDEHTISFEYYPIYKDPYIQKSIWNNPDRQPYVPETNDTKTFDGIRLIIINSPTLNEVTGEYNYWTITPIDSMTYWWTTQNGSEWTKDDFESTYQISVGSSVSSFLGKPIKMPSNYMIVFSDDESFGQALDPATYPIATPGHNTNYRIYDKTNNVEVPYLVAENVFGRQGFVDPLDVIYFYEKDNIDNYRYTWSMIFTERDTSFDALDFGNGDTLFITMTKPFRKGDIYEFATPVPEVNEDLIKSCMSEIRVVPNPYIAATEFESALPPGITSGRGERKVYFQNVPSDATIYIFTSRGQHLRTLEHSGDMFSGTVTWDLKTKENLDIAYGVYFYIVDSPTGGKQSGKLAVIK